MAKKKITVFSKKKKSQSTNCRSVAGKAEAQLGPDERKIQPDQARHWWKRKQRQTVSALPSVVHPRGRTVKGIFVVFFVSYRDRWARRRPQPQLSR